MQLFLLTLPPGESGKTRVDNVNAMLVHANTSANAIKRAKAYFGESGFMWENASAEAIPAISSVEGYTFVLNVTDLDEITVVASEGQTIHDVGQALVDALNTQLENCSYDEATSTITIFGSQNVGDAEVTLELFAPGSSTADEDFEPTITDGGAAEDDVTIQLPSADEIGNRVYKMFNVVSIDMDRAELEHNIQK